MLLSNPSRGGEPRSWSNPAPGERSGLKAAELARQPRKRRKEVLNRNELIVLLLHIVNITNRSFSDKSKLQLKKQRLVLQGLQVPSHRKKKGS